MQLKVQMSGSETDLEASCWCRLHRSVCVLIYLREEKAWKSFARLISE